MKCLLFVCTVVYSGEGEAYFVVSGPTPAGGESAGLGSH